MRLRSFNFLSIILAASMCLPQSVRGNQFVLDWKSNCDARLQELRSISNPTQGEVVAITTLEAVCLGSPMELCLFSDDASQCVTSLLQAYETEAQAKLDALPTLDNIEDSIRKRTVEWQLQRVQNENYSDICDDAEAKRFAELIMARNPTVDEEQTRDYCKTSLRLVEVRSLARRIEELLSNE